jgi:Co/Zn/Cd efflux system component
MDSQHLWGIVGVVSTIAVGWIFYRLAKPHIRRRSKPYNLDYSKIRDLPNFLIGTAGALLAFFSSMALIRRSWSDNASSIESLLIAALAFLMGLLLAIMFLRQSQ